MLVVRPVNCDARVKIVGRMVASAHAYPTSPGGSKQARTLPFAPSVSTASDNNQVECHTNKVNKLEYRENTLKPKRKILCHSCTVPWMALVLR